MASLICNLRTLQLRYKCSGGPIQLLVLTILERTNPSPRNNMSLKTKIEWTDATWNPTRGCTKISPGCQHCYAETWAERFRGVKGNPFEFGFDLRLVPHLLVEPLRWTSPKRVFVNSMSDLFHRDIPTRYLEAVCRVMEATPWHTYQVLTKRADRMAELLNSQLRFAAQLPNVWWGTSVENLQHGLPRVDVLRNTPAQVRFLSCEPLLESLGKLNLEGIGWVIVGGESGPKARPMMPDWVREIRDACSAQRVPFFFKQWGGTRKHLTGRELDGRIHTEFPNRIPASMPTPKQRRTLLESLDREHQHFLDLPRATIKSPIPIAAEAGAGFEARARLP